MRGGASLRMQRLPQQRHLSARLCVRALAPSLSSPYASMPSSSTAATRKDLRPTSCRMSPAMRQAMRLLLQAWGEQSRSGWRWAGEAGTVARYRGAQHLRQPARMHPVATQSTKQQLPRPPCDAAVGGAGSTTDDPFRVGRRGGWALHSHCEVAVVGVGVHGGERQGCAHGQQVCGSRGTEAQVGQLGGWQLQLCAAPPWAGATGVLWLLVGVGAAGVKRRGRGTRAPPQQQAQRACSACSQGSLCDTPEATDAHRLVPGPPAWPSPTAHPPPAARPGPQTATRAAAPTCPAQGGCTGGAGG